jgi:NAD(P)-dependent dehydrogenase (short-subunit alcohol dehydrogenase family)
MWEHGYRKWFVYSQSKLANLLFTYELQRKLAGAGKEQIAVAAHPGWSATNLQAQSWIFHTLNPLFGQPAAMGALPTLYAATAEDVSGGSYYGPGGLAEVRGFPKKVDSNALSKDLVVASRLWGVSEELTGVEYRGL